jgi:hypothetical protein
MVVVKEGHVERNLSVTVFYRESPAEDESSTSAAV